jgi:hypothetical protein
MGSKMAFYLAGTAIAWLICILWIRQVADVQSRSQVLGGLALALIWPLSVPALTVSILAARTSPSLAGPTMAAIPQTASPRAGRSYGTVRALQSVRRNHPSAS